MLSWNQKRRLYEDWQRAAFNLRDQGYEQRNYQDSGVPTTFHLNGQAIILVRLTPKAKWTIKELEPLKQ